MPPTFLCLLAFGVWLCFALFVWLAAGAALLIPFTRRWAVPLAAAMAGTFPGVLLALVATLPLAAALLFTGLTISRFFDPAASETTTNTAVIWIGIALVLCEVLLTAMASLLGFWEGWRTGWLVAKGQRFSQVLARGPTSRLFHVIRKGD